MRHKKIFSTLLLILILSNVVFARAGGGGGGGGYGRGIGSIIALINLALISYLVYRRNKNAKKIISKIHNGDPLWNYDEMIAFTKDTFQRMQNAWMERDMNLVKDI